MKWPLKDLGGPLASFMFSLYHHWKLRVVVFLLPNDELSPLPQPAMLLLAFVATSRGSPTGLEKGRLK